MAEFPTGAIALRFDILTIFPGFFGSIFAQGVVARALKAGHASVTATDLRDFTTDRHRTVDDRPFGGGEGMVLKPEPIFAAAAALGITPKVERDPARETVVLLSAQGKRFTQAIAHQMGRIERVVLVCGRYEGVDERITQHLCDRELSIGDYVLSGGELGAAVIIDAVTRLLPGVLGNADSAHYESFGVSHDSATEIETSDIPAPGIPAPRAVSPAAGLLDYPHYTRPADFGGIAVPAVLLGGDHAAIRSWRRERALEKTLNNRPDLLEGLDFNRDDRRTLDRLRSENLPKISQ